MEIESDMDRKQNWTLWLLGILATLIAVGVVGIISFAFVMHGQVSAMEARSVVESTKATEIKVQTAASIEKLEQRFDELARIIQGQQGQFVRVDEFTRVMRSLEERVTRYEATSALLNTNVEILKEAARKQP